jgi:hypothetical protein
MNRTPQIIANLLFSIEAPGQDLPNIIRYRRNLEAESIPTEQNKPGLFSEEIGSWRKYVNSVRCKTMWIKKK